MGKNTYKTNRKQREDTCCKYDTYSTCDTSTFENVQTDVLHIRIQKFCTRYDTVRPYLSGLLCFIK